jgi:hypothetical protein
VDLSLAPLARARTRHYFESIWEVFAPSINAMINSWSNAAFQQSTVLVVLGFPGICRPIMDKTPRLFYNYCQPN